MISKQLSPVSEVYLVPRATHKIRKLEEGYRSGRAGDYSFKMVDEGDRSREYRDSASRVVTLRRSTSAPALSLLAVVGLAVLGGTLAASMFLTLFWVTRGMPIP
jgi:hypothetical protein